jgi:hypothetical protein
MVGTGRLKYRSEPVHRDAARAQVRGHRSCAICARDAQDGAAAPEPAGRLPEDHRSAAPDRVHDDVEVVKRRLTVR